MASEVTNFHPLPLGEAWGFKMTNISHLVGMMADSTCETWCVLANDAYGARGVLYRSLIHVVLARRFHKCVIWGFLAPLGMAVNRVHYGASWKSGYHTPLGSSPRGPTGAMLAVLESVLLRAHAIHIIRIIPHYFRFVKNDVFHVSVCKYDYCTYLQRGCEVRLNTLSKCSPNR